jgi:hypothetical protein
VTSLLTKNDQGHQHNRQSSFSAKVLGLIVYEFEVCMEMRSGFKMDSTLRVNTRYECSFNSYDLSGSGQSVAVVYRISP